MAARKARLADIGQIALSLPDVEVEGTSKPAYRVHGKTFVFFREPRPDAIDPGTGARMEDVICFRVPDQSDKDALVEADGPFFTTPHFNGYNAVLLRARDIGRVTRKELEEIITDAWGARAPKRLVKQFFRDG
jgi:hypothetical protein